MEKGEKLKPYFRVHVEEHDQVGHWKLYDNLPDASIHISQWIAKAKSINFTRELHFPSEIKGAAA